MREAIKKSRQEKPLGEAGLSKEGDGSLQSEGALGGSQSEEGRQAFCNPEEGESDPLTRGVSGVAGQPLIPRQAEMRPLSPRDRRRGDDRGRRQNWPHLDVQALAVQVQTRLPLVPAVPVPPEQRSRPHHQRMEQDAYLARFGRGTAAPLALLPQRTWTAIANASGIDHPQTTIAFSPSLVRNQHIACSTAQGPIRLKGKVCAREAAS